MNVLRRCRSFHVDTRSCSVRRQKEIQMRKILIAAAIAIGAALAAPAQASEALPPTIALQLDEQPVEFTQSAASHRRHMIIQQNMRQLRHGRGYVRGYGPGGRYGYGRAYGHRRGYGPRPGYGYRRF